MTTEQKTQIESLLGNTDKQSLMTLNGLRESIDGVRINNCFCSSTARRAIASDFKKWYDTYTNNNG